MFWRSVADFVLEVGCRGCVREVLEVDLLED